MPFLAGGVGVEAEDGEVAVAEEPLELVRHALGAGAVPREGARAALRAALGQVSRVAAVVTLERPGSAVQDERDVAVGAAPDQTA